MKKFPHWAGAALVILVVIAGFLGSCGCAIVRVAVEHGEGGLHADTGTIRADIDADMDGVAMPFSGDDE